MFILVYSSAVSTDCFAGMKRVFESILGVVCLRSHEATALGGVSTKVLRELARGMEHAFATEVHIIATREVCMPQEAIFKIFSICCTVRNHVALSGCKSPPLAVASVMNFCLADMFTLKTLF